jgi:hypothetical protein
MKQQEESQNWIEKLKQEYVQQIRSKSKNGETALQQR